MKEINNIDIVSPKIVQIDSGYTNKGDDNSNNAWKVLLVLSALQQILSNDIIQNSKVSNTISDIQFKMLEDSVEIMNNLTEFLTNNNINDLKATNQRFATIANTFMVIGGVLTAIGSFSGPLAPLILPIGVGLSGIGYVLKLIQGVKTKQLADIQSKCADLSTIANVYDAMADNCGMVWDNSNQKLVNKMKTKDALTAFNYDNIQQMGSTLKVMNKKVS